MEDESRLLAENAALKKKIAYLEAVIEAHHVAKFEDNVNRLKLSVRTGFKQISSELSVMEHDPKNAERVMDLVDFVQHYADELQQFIYKK